MALLIGGFIVVGQSAMDLIVRRDWSVASSPRREWPIRRWNCATPHGSFARLDDDWRSTQEAAISRNRPSADSRRRNPRSWQRFRPVPPVGVAHNPRTPGGNVAHDRGFGVSSRR